MNKPKNFYKVHTNDPVGVKISDYVKRCNDAADIAREWAEKLGASSYYEAPDGMAGGCMGLEFETTPAHPELVKLEGFEDDEKVQVYIPAPESELEKEMYALPVISEIELITILALQPVCTKDGKKLPMTFGKTTPEVFRYKDCWFVNVPYTSIDDNMIAITEKDYYRTRMAAINTQTT